MGEKLEPQCEKCGYNPQRVTIGAGKENFGAFCGVPALDKATNEVVTLNYFEKSKIVMAERNFAFYNEDGMFEPSEDFYYFTWGSLKFQSQKNFCPKCKTFNLRFYPGVLFD